MRERAGTVAGWAHHPHDFEFLQGLRSEIVPGWERHIARRYSGLFKRRGRRAANLAMLPVRELCQAVRGTLGHGLDLATDDQAIRDQADVQARRCGRMDNPRAYVESLGLKPADAETEQGERERYKCAKWWRRRLRQYYGRTLERAAIEARIVHKHADCYASQVAVDRRRAQNARNRALLDEVHAENEDGQAYTLAELAALSVSNPKLRRAELMTRSRGFERIAQWAGDVAEFWTVTCPSRMHPVHSESGKANSAYDGTTPRQAQQYLSGKVWARARAKFARRGIELYGLRVAEPHHDGTPHWHLLVFMAPERADEARAIMRHYALIDSPDEKGAQRYRFKAERIDAAKGTATGYLAKYISKAIDGYAIDEDLFGNDAKSAAERVSAWAATWGIRQFQQVGGPSVTVWRELRRMDYQDAGQMEGARAAADAGDWAGFVQAMGGAVVPRQLRPVRLLTLQDFDAETGEMPRNAYGEPAAGRVIGLQAGSVAHVTRWRSWTITKGRPLPEPEAPLWETLGPDWVAERFDAVRGPGQVIVQAAPQWLRDKAEGASLEHVRRALAAGEPRFSDFELERATSAPWTRVNNCTGGVVDGNRESDDDGGGIPAEWSEYTRFAGAGPGVEAAH